MPSSPSNAEQWADKLCKKRLPVLPYIGSQFIKDLNTQDISLVQLSKRVQQDPTLALQIFIEANSSERNVSSELLKLEHCVSLLGLKRVKTLASKLPILKVARRSYCYQRYLSSIQQSVFSAQIATTWIKSKSKTAPNLYYPTLFYGTGAWLLWRHEIAEIYKLEELIFNQNQSLSEAEENIFGCQIREISIKLNQRWKLPELSQEALKLDFSGHRKTLARINYSTGGDEQIHTPPFSAELNILKSNAAKIKLANELASELDANWHSRYSQRTINISAALLNISPKNQRHQIQQLALSQSQKLSHPGINSPAGKMLQLPSLVNHHDIQNSYLGLLHRNNLQNKTTWREENILSAEKRASSSQKGTSPKPNSHKASETRLLWKNLLSGNTQSGKLQQKNFEAFITELETLACSGNKISAHEVLKLTVTAHACCIGFSRCAFFQYDQNNNTLSYLCGTGFQHEKAGLKKAILLKPAQLFMKLFSQPTGLWVNPDKREKILAMLPEGFASFTHEQEFALMSTFTSGQASGIFYCDRQGLQDTISEDQYKAFKFLCQTCSHTLSAIELKKAPANQGFSEDFMKHML
ncbi:MAG: HDOD domain-containing protein [Gammaproteobacteria bacterium]|nr:HDOD domain-containing protein [Gammaproteobacteria bacterium]